MAGVYLPRMEIEWEADLNEMLIALGMGNALGGDADFSRLTPVRGVRLGLVEQQAFVKVGEEGTEAAAVTGASLWNRVRPWCAPEGPFRFVLRERLTGAVLFLAVVNDPTP